MLVRNLHGLRFEIYAGLPVLLQRYIHLEVVMPQRFSLGVQLIIGLLPVCYGAVVVAALPNTWQWALMIALAMLVLLVLCGSFGYPLQTIWPVFPAAFLSLVCTAVLFQGAFDRLPLTRQPSELIAMYIVAALYLGWGVGATWKAYTAFA
jgi:hypothetical protein